MDINPAPEWWPAWDPFDPTDEPEPIGLKPWYPEPFHRPFHPPNYHDWLRENPGDMRDRDYSPSEIESDTGLPPEHLQGHEYVPGDWRFTNGNGTPGSGHVLRWNVRPQHGNKQRRLAFVWPSDGKRKHTWGRWKDIFSSRGPDIFATKLGDRPSRNQWRNRHMDVTPEDPGYNTHVDMPWAARREPYDFRSRRYTNGKRGEIVWADATWPSQGADHYTQPLNYRCEHGTWYNIKWSPFGGVVLEGYNGRGPSKKGIFR